MTHGGIVGGLLFDELINLFIEAAKIGELRIVLVGIGFRCCVGH